MAKDHKVHKFKGIMLGRKTKGRGVKFKVIKPGSKVWKCVLPGCPTYISDKELMIGKLTECHECGNPFEIKRFHLERDNIKCSECRGESSKIIKEVEKSKDLIADTLNDLLSGLPIKGL